MHSIRLRSVVIGSLFLAAACLPERQAWSQSEIINPAWNVVDVLRGTKPSFDFDAQGRVHVMGFIEAFENEGGQVWYATADSPDGPFTKQFVAPGYFYGPGDLKVDPSGTANLIWHNHDPGEVNHATISPQGVSNWNKINAPGHNGWDNAAAIDRNGVLHTSSVNPTGFGPVTDSLEYGTFDGTSWTYQTVPGSGAFRYGFNTSLAFDSANNPNLLYCDCEGFTAFGGALRLATKENGDWQISTIDSGGRVGRFPVMAIDSEDRIHAAWLDVDDLNDSVGRVRYGVWDGDAWDIETIDTLDNLFLRDNTNGARKVVSIELDSSGRPRVAFGDSRVVKYASLSGDEWTTTTVTELLDTDPSPFNGQVVMRLDADNRPTIAFWQRADGAQSPGMVRLATLSLTPGDASGDNRVDRDDLAILSANYGVASGATFGQGDFSGDGAVSLSDLAILRRGFFAQSAASPAAVPEPSSLLLGVFAMLWAAANLRLRRRATL